MVFRDKLCFSSEKLCFSIEKQFIVEKHFIANRQCFHLKNTVYREKT